MRPFRHVTAVVVVALLVAFVSQQINSQPAAAPAEGRVVRVVDGDTIVVALRGGHEKIRLLLVDTPETVKPGVGVQCYGRAASAETKRLLHDRRVRLTYDRELHDRYGRTLAYVSAGGRDVGAGLVAGGFARVKVYPPNRARAAAYKRLERGARDRRAGLWGSCKN